MAENGKKKMPEGRPFTKGVSGNPGGRPKGIASSARRILEDAAKQDAAVRAGIESGPDVLTRFWLNTMADSNADIRIRLAASELLADRAYGKAPMFAPVEGEDPLGLDEEAIHAAVAEFRAQVIRLAPASDTGEAAPRNGS